MSEFNGRNVLVTGATTGIGFATARAFLTRGAKVAITGLDKFRLEDAKAKLGNGVLAVPADNASREDSHMLAQVCQKEFGNLDTLICNAGICLSSTIDALDEKTFDREFDVNVKGTMFLIAACLPLLVAGSSILVTTSGNDVKGLPGQLVYSATKAALRSMVRTLAAELAPRGIRVNGVAPGPIDTPIFEKAISDPKVLQQVKNTEAQWLAMKRLGTPEHIAEAFVFLASDSSSFTTGIDMRVDGGWVDL